MGVYTFVCRTTGNEWTAKQYSGDIEASATTSFELQRKLVQFILSSDSGVVKSSFAPVTPSSAVFQVIVGGATGGGGAVAASAPSGGAAAEAAEPVAEEKKEVKEESDEEDMIFSLFD